MINQCVLEKHVTCPTVAKGLSCILRGYTLSIWFMNLQVHYKVFSELTIRSNFMLDVILMSVLGQDINYHSTCTPYGTREKRSENRGPDNRLYSPRCING